MGHQTDAHCTGLRGKKVMTKRSKVYFVRVWWLPRVLDTWVFQSSNERQNSRLYSLLFEQNSYFLWKMTAKQAACLFLGDLTWNALAKSILVSLLEVKFLRLGTAGPELPEGSSGSFPTAPHCVLRTVPAGQSQENLWSRMFLWRISQRALTKEDSPSAINGKFALGTDPYPK